MLTAVNLAHQVVTLERRVKALQHHVHKLEAALSTVRSGSPPRRSWWQVMWKRGTGDERRTMASPRSVRENKRRVNHEHIQQSQLYCA